jgi:hypothetical protein
MRKDTAIGLKMTKGYTVRILPQAGTDIVFYVGDINAVFRHWRETKLN